MNTFDNEFLENGFVDLGQILDKEKCQELLRQIYETRNFGLVSL